MIPKKINGLPLKEYFVSGHGACSSCGPAITMRLITKAAGDNTILVNSTGCMEVVSTKYPQTSWALPWVHGAFENAAPIASGIHAALTAQGRRDKHNIMVISGDGASFDIGFGALSGALERGDKFTFICYDNEQYANCLALSSLIMTEEGLKNIKEIKKGERIYAFNLKNHQLVLKKCSGIFNNGNKKVYDLETLHHSIRATSNHPFLILKHNGRGNENSFVWKKLSEIRIGDEIIVLKNLSKGNSFKFKPIKPSKIGDYKITKLNNITLPKQSSPELMEFLGLFVGDGWIRLQKGEVGFAIPEKTRERKRLLLLNSKIFKAKINRTDKYYVYINSINLAKFINSLGIAHKAKDKTIPGWIFTLPKNEKEAFINGLIASDGYTVNKSLRYVSSSYELLRRLRLLLQTIDYRVGKIHWRTVRKGTKCVYRPLLKDCEAGYICFSKKRLWNTKKYKSQYKYQNFLVENGFFNIERVNHKKFVKIEPTLDLRVDDEHNFIANGIVVHNTGMQRSGATPFSAWTSTTPIGSLIAGKEHFKKPLAEIVAAHNIPYVATATIAYPHDLYNKVKKSFSFNGPSFIHVLAPCVLGWKYKTDQTIEVSRLAVQTGMFLLYEVENGVFKLNVEPEFMPVEDYLKIQGRFKHLKEEQIKKIQEHVKNNYENIKKCINCRKNQQG